MWMIGIVLSATLAALAWHVARTRPAHRAVAALVALGVVADVARRMLALFVLEPARARLGRVAFVGVVRAFFHLDEALFIAFPFGLAGLAVVAFVERPRRLASAVLVAYGVTVAMLVLGYPTLRGATLAGLFSGVHLAALAVVGASFRAWWRRRARPDLTVGSVMVLAALDLGALIAWRVGWDAAAAMYLLAHGALIVLHLGELWDGSRSLA